MSTTKTTIRGGWSTSIKDSFADPSHRSDCCIMICCGLFLHDRNGHWIQTRKLRQQQRPTAVRTGIPLGAWSRVVCYVCLPIVIVSILLASKQVMLGEQIRINHAVNITKALTHNNSSGQDSVDDDLVLEEDNVWDVAILAVIIIISVFLCCVAQGERQRNREAILLMMLEEKEQQAKMDRGDTDKNKGNNNDDDDDDDDGEDAIMGESAYNGGNGSMSAASVLLQNKMDTYAAHNCWKCCYTNDIRNETIVLTEETAPPAMVTAPPKDLCTFLYSIVNACCCGMCCNTYCQCFGMCGLAQEDRELHRLLTAEERQIDHITYQPYNDYFSRIQQLRAQQSERLYQHACWATSQLTQQLYKIVGGLLLFLTIVACSTLDPNFQVTNLILVFATLAQSAIVLGCVHWCSPHKFDLSLDAVVKYFASGFCLATFLSMIYELLVQGVIGTVMSIIVTFGIADQIDFNSPDPTQIERLSRIYRREHVGLSSIFAFLQAFVVAALVEEMAKYYGYWMVETPDLTDPDQLAEPSEPNTDLVLATENENGNMTAPSHVSVKDPPRTLVSRGAGTTIAMVAVAAGFACSENFMYVFVYAPPGIENQIGTLIARSVFPIHALCAAIQSIGVNKRDLEKDPKWQLGRILFPAILLHGCFDFIVMLLNVLLKHRKFVENGGIIDDDDAAAKGIDANDGENQQEEVGLPELIGMVMTVVVVIAAVLYYICQATAQRKRLAELDEERRDDGPGSSSPLV